MRKKNQLTLTVAFAILPLLVSAEKSSEAIQDEINLQKVNDILEKADTQALNPDVSPVRRINRQMTVTTKANERPSRPPERPPAQGGGDFRSIAGVFNNQNNPLMGSAGSQLLRLVDADYGDGISTLAGQDRASARAISNAISAQIELAPNQQNGSDFIWQWGQFLDHDIDLTDGVNPAEPANIVVPSGDVYFDPSGSGDVSMSLNRSVYDLQTGTDVNNPRQQLNEITSWIDASNVYGSDQERADALRIHDGSGKLKTSTGNLLPFNIEGFANAGGSSDQLFLAGDVRANEQLGLTAVHTLFMREHNWQAENIKRSNPQMSGNEVYQRARQMVGAEIQAISYYEYLPALLGRGAISRYEGYKPDIDAGIANLFSGALYRYGHSALSPTLKRLNAQGASIEAGDLALRDAFFSPSKLVEEGGIEPLLRGLSAQICQKVDNYIIDDVRNFLFGPPGSGGFDLAALNIQRGRDHGLPSYNSVRLAYGLDAAETFAEITTDTLKQQALASVYDSVNDVDLWVGGLSEDPVDGALVGELIKIVLIEQFEALRDGDRYWYENILNNNQREVVRSTKLSDIIRRNTNIGRELADDVFHVRRPR